MFVNLNSTVAIPTLITIFMMAGLAHADDANATEEAGAQLQPEAAAAGE